MRTTVTLDSDAAALVRRAMAAHGWTFKEAINEAVRRALADDDHARVSTPTFAMGPPTVPLDRALALAGDLDDEETLRRMGSEG